MPLNTLSALDAARRIASGEITSEALVRACLERIAERDADVRAWQFLDPELALSQARVLDRGPARGPLHGVPLGVKDVFDTHDMPTEHGSAAWVGNRPRNDAATLATARHAGMVILGKTVTTELAASPPSRTRNPRNLEHTPGGSSSGSAAAVADLMVPMATGTQTVGSTIRPASFCGVVGYKPTFNLLSRAGVKVEGDSLDTVGLFARSVLDVAAYAAVETNDSRLLQIATFDGKPHIGLCRAFEWDLAKPESHAAVEETALRLEKAGATVRDVRLPERFRGLLDAHRAVFAFEMRRSFADEHLRAGKLSPSLAARWEEYKAITGATYLQAQSLALECRAALKEVFGDFQVFLAPAAVGEAPRGFETTGDPVMNQVWTFLHVPAVTLPVARGPNGLPIGVQVIGRIGDDVNTLSVAHWAHAATGAR
jgi:Asp-tRNA(Asn)/Glu-tRNA(Gln) amidotransferase A subunit family amidase